jgi:GDPmannose 4,6-dehydratase
MEDNKKKCIIWGANGQDGSYLCELLLEKGYEVHGTIRRSSVFNTERIDHIFNKIQLHYSDVTDPLSVSNLIAKIQPDEIYNLAAQSHVQVSFEQPFYTGSVDGLGTLSIIEAVKNHCKDKVTKIYQASTSEMYGGVGSNMSINGYVETDSFYPRSPYGCAKLYGYWITKNYREAYNMFICNGLLFNHESERRTPTFVTRKITRTMAQMKLSGTGILKIGNLNAKRDWGYAKDFVEAMWLMLQQDKPDDYVVATGEAHSVREFASSTAEHLGWTIVWTGEGKKEKGHDYKTGRLLVEVDDKYFRPTEVDFLLGDATKAKIELGWTPTTSFEDLVELMITNDLKELQGNKQLAYHQ